MNEVEMLKAAQGDARMVRYIVQLEPGVWMAPWSGDPGRTTEIHNARVFASEKGAEMAMRKVRAKWGRPFLGARTMGVHIEISHL